MGPVGGGPTGTESGVDPKGRASGAWCGQEHIDAFLSNEHRARMISLQNIPFGTLFISFVVLFAVELEVNDV